MTDEPENRRPLKVRQAAFAHRLAARLAGAGVHPDTISAASVAFSVLGGALMMTAGGVHGGLAIACWILAAACIQVRLLCNLLDGLVAVEHGKAGPAGPIWNELPDRIADVVLLAAAGYAARTAGQPAGEALGWLAAVLAVLTAYVRELGRGLGLPADFSGPMAKQQRMAELTAFCLASVAEPLWHGRGATMVCGLLLIAAGCVVTLVKRTGTIAARLRER